MNFQAITSSKWALPVLCGAAGAVVGGAGGYIYGKRNGTMTIIENTYITEPDVDCGPEDVNDDPTLPFDEVPFEELVEDDLEPTFVEPKPPTNYVTTNVFTPTAPEWDEEAEAENRVFGEPHVIPVDEYMNNTNGFSQETLTYYAEDDKVADQSDVPIYNYSGMMGELKFGHGSGDQNVVYIRNPSLRIEWEILRHSGSYEEEVAGLSIEREYETKDLKHSNDRKFREE